MTAPWWVRYDGTCRLCGRALRKGEPAVYERSLKTIRCIECPSAAAGPAEASGEAEPHRPANLAAEPVAAEPVGAQVDVEVEAEAEFEPGRELDLGVAGGSARREFERRRAKRGDRIRGQWGNRLGGLWLAISSEPQHTRAWARGAWGEVRLAKALDGIPDLFVLHDRSAPGTRGNIDHIAVCPAGVFVIDAKAHQGRVEVRDKGGLFRTDLRLYVGGCDCSRLAEGLDWQVEAVTDVLAGAGLPAQPPVTPVLCFVDAEWPLLFPPNSYRDALLEGPRSIRKRLTVAPALAPDVVEPLARLLAAALPGKAG